MSKHTSGPWEAGRLQPHVDGRSRVEITEVGELGILAHVYVPDTEVSRRGNREGSANALLIASAPELLNQLKRARNALDGIDPGVEQLAVDTQAIIREIDAAIAKAEGSREE